MDLKGSQWNNFHLASCGRGRALGASDGQGSGELRMDFLREKWVFCEFTHSGYSREWRRCWQVSNFSLKLFQLFDYAKKSIINFKLSNFLKLTLNQFMGQVSPTDPIFASLDPDGWKSGITFGMQSKNWNQFRRERIQIYSFSDGTPRKMQNTSRQSKSLIWWNCGSWILPRWKSMWSKSDPGTSCCSPIATSVRWFSFKHWRRLSRWCRSCRITFTGRGISRGLRRFPSLARVSTWVLMVYSETSQTQFCYGLRVWKISMISFNFL